VIGLIISAGPVVRFLREQCAELGGDINSSNVRCRPCRSNQFAGFDPDYGIVLCSDQLASRSRKDLEDSLAHEMVHAYDYLRFKFDRTNMKHAACTEVFSSLPRCHVKSHDILGKSSNAQWRVSILPRVLEARKL
jgi:mitochondrial inner membrane protease ATP23